MDLFREILISSQAIHWQIGPRKIHPQHCPCLGPHISILVTVTALGFHILMGSKHLFHWCFHCLLC